MMGPSVLEWFIPTTPEHIKNGDGVTFKTRLLLMEEIKVEKDENDGGGQWAQKRQRKQTVDEQ